MSKLELVRALYEYNEWADNHVLEAASRLSDQEFTSTQGASYDTVEGNLRHILSAQVGWLSRWTERWNPRHINEIRALRGLAALREAFGETHDALRLYVQASTDARLDEPLPYVDSEGKQHQRVLWQLMAHVVNHGTHHRAETAMAMAALGKPMRELDYVFFEIERDGR